MRTLQTYNKFFSVQAFFSENFICMMKSAPKIAYIFFMVQYILFFCIKKTDYQSSFDSLLPVFPSRTLFSNFSKICITVLCTLMKASLYIVFIFFFLFKMNGETFVVGISSCCSVTNIPPEFLWKTVQFFKEIITRALLSLMSIRMFLQPNKGKKIMLWHVSLLWSRLNLQKL